MSCFKNLPILPADSKMPFLSCQDPPSERSPGRWGRGGLEETKCARNLHRVGLRWRMLAVKGQQVGGGGHTPVHTAAANMARVAPHCCHQRPARRASPIWQVRKWKLQRGWEAHSQPNQSQRGVPNPGMPNPRAAPEHGPDGRMLSCGGDGGITPRGPMGPTQCPALPPLLNVTAGLWGNSNEPSGVS